MNHAATAMLIPWASRWKAARVRIVRRNGTAAKDGLIDAKKRIVFARDTSFRSGAGESEVPGFVHD
jgi:hypothetical protein